MDISVELEAPGLADQLPPELEGRSDQEKFAVLLGQIKSTQREIAALKAQLAVIQEFERARDVILQRHANRPARELATAVSISADEFIDTSDGFWFLEHAKDGTPFRWTRPGRYSRFSFWIERNQPIMLTLTMASTGRLGEHDRMTAEVDGALYELTPAGRRKFEAGPVAPRSAYGPTEVRLHVPVAFNPSREGGGDARDLGVAIAQFEARVIA